MGLKDFAPKANKGQFFLNSAGWYAGSGDGPGKIRRNSHGMDHGMPNTPFGYLKFFNFDNAYEINSTNVWNQGAVGSGTALAAQNKRGGWGIFTNASGDNNFYQYFSKYEIGKLVASKNLWFRTQFECSEATQVDIWLGLCKEINTNTIDATHNVFDNRVDAIGFIKADGSTAFGVECTKNSTATTTASAHTLVADTRTVFGFKVVGTEKVEFWVNDEFVCAIATNLPDDEELAFSFGCRNGDGTARAMQIGQTVLLQDE